MPVQRHAGDAHWQARSECALAGDIVARRALLQGRAHDHVVDLARLDPGARHGLGDGMAAERLGLGVVEGAAIGLADRRAGG